MEARGPGYRSAFATLDGLRATRIPRTTNEGARLRRWDGKRRRKAEGSPSRPFMTSPSTGSSPSSASSSSPANDATSTAQRFVRAATCGLVRMYCACNPSFAEQHRPERHPRRYLTFPAARVSNNGNDNRDHDLVMSVGDELWSGRGILPHASSSAPHGAYDIGRGTCYRVVDLLGCGTFGQVVRCLDVARGVHVAVKVVRNRPAYFHQGIVEARVLRLVRARVLRRAMSGACKLEDVSRSAMLTPRQLNNRFDCDDRRIVKMLDFFVYKKHLCFVFELLSINLFDLLKQNNYRGFSLNLIRILLSQIIKSLMTLREVNVIHCDLKPENILLCTYDWHERKALTPVAQTQSHSEMTYIYISNRLSSPKIKLIDFGSACFRGSTVYSYIQSRYYRSPEVLVGHDYDEAIDTWSLGCIAAELYLGLPLLPGASEYEQVQRIICMFGAFPEALLNGGKKASKFFALRNGSGVEKYVFKNREEYQAETGVEVGKMRRYFSGNTLRQVILRNTKRNSSSDDAREGETSAQVGDGPSEKTPSGELECFLHFIGGLLRLDPRERWSPDQAYAHPFIQNAPFEVGWQPPPKTEYEPDHEPMVPSVASAPSRFSNRSAPMSIQQTSRGSVSQRPQMSTSCPHDMFLTSSSAPSHASALLSPPSSFVGPVGTHVYQAPNSVWGVSSPAWDPRTAMLGVPQQHGAPAALGSYQTVSGEWSAHRAVYPPPHAHLGPAMHTHDSSPTQLQAHARHRRRSSRDSSREHRVMAHGQSWDGGRPGGRGTGRGGRGSGRGGRELDRGGRGTGRGDQRRDEPRARRGQRGSEPIQIRRRESAGVWSGGGEGLAMYSPGGGTGPMMHATDPSAAHQGSFGMWSGGAGSWDAPHWVPREGQGMVGEAYVPSSSWDGPGGVWGAVGGAQVPQRDCVHPPAMGMGGHSPTSTHAFPLHLSSSIDAPMMQHAPLGGLDVRPELGTSLDSSTEDSGGWFGRDVARGEWDAARHHDRGGVRGSGTSVSERRRRSSSGGSRSGSLDGSGGWGCNQPFQMD